MTRREKGEGICSIGGFIKRPERFCLIVATVGCLLSMISCFIDRWRIDVQGMNNWEPVMGAALSKYGNSFKSRTYGLMNVKGNIRNSWKAQAQGACSYRDMNAIYSAGASIATMIKAGSISACKDSKTDGCSSGPTVHLSVRCEEYGNMSSAGSLTLAFTLIGIFLILGTLLAGMQCNKARVGGVIFGCQLLGSFLIVIFNIVWAVRSDGAFRRIMDSAWYPYPTLGVAYYLHLFGGLFTLVASIFYGIIVMPEVTKYDPLGKVIEKREKRLMDAKVNAAKQQHNQNQGFMQNQQVAPPVMMVQQQPMMYMQQPQPVYVGGGQDFGMNHHQQGGFQQQPQMYPQTVGAPQQTVFVEQQHQGYQMPAAPPSGF